MTLQTEFEFILPRGFIGKEGNLHRTGVMRLANARDEIAPLEDPRVRRNEAYLLIILLARTITRLGDLADINTGVIEGLFSSDLTYLQDLYNRINQTGSAAHDVVCPECSKRIAVDLDPPGESFATPLNGSTGR